MINNIIEFLKHERNYIIYLFSQYLVFKSCAKNLKYLIKNLTIL